MKELISIDYYELIWEFANKFLLGQPIDSIADLQIINKHKHAIEYKTNYDWNINRNDVRNWLNEICASPIFIWDNQLITHLLNYIWDRTSYCEDVAHDIEKQIKKYNNKLKFIKKEYDSKNNE